MTDLPAIPEPSAVDFSRVAFCEQLVLWAQTSDDTEQLKEARDKLSAIDEYYAQSRQIEGRNLVVATMRRIEVRIGELLNAEGEHRGGRTDRGTQNPTAGRLPKNLASDARKMAANPDVVDRVIAESTDENPATRKKVVDAIAPKPSVSKPRLVKLTVMITSDQWDRFSAGAEAHGYALEEFAVRSMERVCKPLLDGAGKAQPKPARDLPPGESITPSRSWSDSRICPANGRNHKSSKVTKEAGWPICDNCGKFNTGLAWITVAS